MEAQTGGARRVSVSVVIPTYRNARGIATTIAHLESVLADDWEVVFVDDMSPDDTWPVLSAAIRDKPRFRAVRLARNLGQHRATRMGLGLARGSIVLTMDDDLQHPVSEVGSLVAKMRPDVDVVYGCYRKREHEAWRRLASWFAHVTLRLTLDLAKTEPWQRPTSFRVLSRRIVDRIALTEGHGFMLDGWLHAHTSRIEYVPVQHDARFHGRTSYTFKKLVLLYLDLLFGYSVKPIAYVTAIGLAASALGLALVAWAVASWALSAATGAQPLVLACGAVLLLVVQLVATVIVGQYVGRTYLQRSLLRDDEHLFVERIEPAPPQT